VRAALEQLAGAKVRWYNPMTSQRFWPFDPRYAWWTSAVLLPVSVGIAAVLQATGVLPGRRMPWWLLLGAVLVGLLPVILLILGRVRTVRAAGVEVTFAAVRRAVRVADAATVRSTLSDNLGAPPGVVLDTAGDTVIQALRAAVTNDVVVVNVGDGHEWWDTRLLLLVAGAARLGHPAAIAFTATDAGRPDQFVGWGVPAELLRTQLGRKHTWRAAYRRAQRNTLLYTVAETEGVGPMGRLPWPASGRQRIAGTVPQNLTRLAATTAEGQAELPWPDPKLVYVHAPSNSPGPDDPYLAERFLLQELRPLEETLRPDRQEELELTSDRVQDLFRPVLYHDFVDTDDSQTHWLDHVLGTTTPFIAVTTAGRLVSLVPRIAAVNGVLRGLVRDQADAARVDGDSDRADAGSDQAAGPDAAAPPT
jgi:hypothetical protein